MPAAPPAALNRWHALLGLLIAYGSLYPFDFVLPEAVLPAIHAMLADSALWSSRGDVLGNVLLFMPWGAAATWQPHAPLRARLPVLLGGLALAAVLQLMQIALPSRDAAVSDIIWNAAGLLLGQFALAPLIARLQHRGGADGRTHALAYGVAGLWLLSETLPFIPSIDLAHLKAGVNAFLAGTPPSPAVLLGAFAGVLTVGHIALLRLSARSALAGLLLALPVLALARLVIIHNTVHWQEAAAWAAAWVALLLLRTPARTAPAGFVAMLGALSLAGLAPYGFSMHAGTFNWMPFAGYLEGNMLGNLRELLDTVWYCVALLWLAHAMGARVAGVGAFLTAWVLALESAQLWLPGRSADITPVLTALLVSLLMTHLTRKGTPVRSLAARSAPGVPEHAPSAGMTTQHAWWRPLAWAVPAWLAGTALLSWLISQPGVPYNLRELFLGDGHPLAIALFGLAVLSLGAGPRLAIGRAALAPHPALSLPALLCAGGLLTLALLALSVTGESLDDIAGSNNRYWWVTEREVWGPWAAELFRSHLSQEIVAPVERMVRFLALYLPPAAFLAFALAAIELRLPARQLATIAAALAPLLWLCKAIAFDWSSTDNLNELIAPDGRFGWGGGGYLYLLLALAAANIALLVRRTPRRWLAAPFTLAALPLSWWLLSMGLAGEIHKYGLVYSGPQFLLGPDRIELLDRHMLQLRWAGVYLALLIAGSAGAVLARDLQPVRAGR